MGMKISGEETIKLLQALQKHHKIHAGQKDEPEGATEKSGFSSEMKQIKKGNGISAATDLERAEKLESLHAQIKNGSYDPDMRDVASSLLDYLSRMGS